MVGCGQRPAEGDEEDGGCALDVEMVEGREAATILWCSFGQGRASFGWFWEKKRREEGGSAGFKSGWSEGDETNLWLRLSVSEGELFRERL